MTVNKKKPRGRPEVADKDKRSVLMQFRMTEAEAKQINAAATKAGQSKSDWLRDTVLAKAGR